MHIIPEGIKIEIHTHNEKMQETSKNKKKKINILLTFSLSDVISDSKMIEIDRYDIIR